MNSAMPWCCLSEAFRRLYCSRPILERGERALRGRSQRPSRAFSERGSDGLATWRGAVNAHTRTGRAAALFRDRCAGLPPPVGTSQLTELRRQRRRLIVDVLLAGGLIGLVGGAG